MRARVRLLVVGLLLAGCASAPRPAAAGAAPAKAGPLGWGDDPADRAPGPLLFEVEGRGGRLDLFGTMHTEPLAMLPKAAAARYEAARVVAFEVDVENMSVLKVLAVSMLPFNQSLDQMIGPEAWAKLVKYLDGMAVPAVLKRFRPWAVMALMLSKAGGIQKGAETMDAGMLKEGRSSGKQVRFLETVEQQIAILDRTVDAAFLVKLIADADQLTSALTAMTDAYRAGDVAAVETAVGSMDSDTGLTGEQKRMLLGARNERWIPFLEQLMADGGAFVAVGAGHLIGKDGLVALLRARGYRVSRVRQ